MTGTFQFFVDAGLTAPIQSGAPSRSSLSYDGSSGNVDYAVFLGSATTGRVLQAASNPGIDQIVVEAPTLTPGSGQPAALTKIALTQGGLDTGTQSLNVGTSVLSGVANALPVWVRDNITGGSAVLGSYANLEFRLLGAAESAV